MNKIVISGMNKNLKVIVYFLCIFLLFELTISQQTSGKLFLLGGATSDTSSNIYLALRQATDQLFPKIAVAISAAASLSDGLSAYYDSEPDSKSYEQLFTDYGFIPTVIHLAIDNYQMGSSNATSLGRENIEKIRNADIVFFNGGDQSRHSRAWLNDDGTDSPIMFALRQRFNEGLVIAGTSAGTAIQGEQTFGGGRSYGYYYFNADLKQCEIGEELSDNREGNNTYRYDENGAFVKGFGFLTGALTDTHFDARGRFARLVAAMKNIGHIYGLGVDEDTAVYIYDDIVTVYGTWGVWIIDNSEATFPTTNSYFAAQSVRIAYLTEGDSYNLTNKMVTSVKPVITGENGGAYNSDDIFSTDEALFFNKIISFFFV